MLDMVAKDALPDWARKAATSNPEPLAAARALRPLIEEHADEGERQGQVSDDVIKAIADAGLFGLLVPKEFGGSEVGPREYIDVIEELAYADGSTGWIVMATTYGIANTTTKLGDSILKAMFQDGQGFICAGQAAPTGKVRKVEGGYQGSGRFQFGSGSRWSSWLFGLFMVVDDNGAPVKDANGRPEMRMLAAPRESVQLDASSWDVMGLAGTSSYDFIFPEQFFPDDAVMEPMQRPQRGGAMYKIGVSIAHVAWALGAAMRILDEVEGLARRKRRQGRASLIDTPRFQEGFANNKMKLEACRSLIRDVFQQWYDLADAGEQDLLPVTAKARAASCWATEQCKEIAHWAQHAAGSDGARNAGGTNKLQRAFRDLEVGSTHRHIDENILQDCATVMLGVNAPDIVL